MPHCCRFSEDPRSQAQVVSRSADKLGDTARPENSCFRGVQVGINVNAVAPTFIDMPGTAERLDDPVYRQKVVDRLPIGHLGTAPIWQGSHLFDITGRSSGDRQRAYGDWTAQ